MRTVAAPASVDGVALEAHGDPGGIRQHAREGRHQPLGALVLQEQLHAVPRARDAAQSAHRERRGLPEIGAEAREEVTDDAGGVSEQRPATGVGSGEPRD